MSAWKSILNGDPTGWLLEASDPSIHYFTLRWLFDLPKDIPAVSIAAQALAHSAPIKKLQFGQLSQG